MLVNDDVQSQIGRRRRRGVIERTVRIHRFAKQCILYVEHILSGQKLRIIVEKIINDHAGQLRAGLREFRKAMCSLDHSWSNVEWLYRIGVHWLIHDTFFRRRAEDAVDLVNIPSAAVVLDVFREGVAIICRLRDYRVLSEIEGFFQRLAVDPAVAAVCSPLEGMVAAEKTLELSGCGLLRCNCRNYREHAKQNRQDF